MPGAGEGSTGTPRGSAVKRMLGDMQDKAMFALIGKAIIYNVSWEDPRLDCEMLNLQPENKDTILMLTSGGCNVLDMLLEGPAMVVGGDLNPRQNALLELKTVAIKHCTYDQFFAIFAKSDYDTFAKVFPTHLKPHLSEFAAHYWEENKSFFKAVLWSGMSGFAAKMMLNVCTLLGLGGLIEKVKHCATLEEQRALYAQYEPTAEAICKLVNFTKRLWCPFIAVPANQLHLFDGNVVKHAVDNLFLNTHIAGDNYFYYGYMYGEYTEQCCPRYLKRENFARLRSLIDRVVIRTGTLQEVAASFPDGHFSRYILLDHMDWMPMSMVLDEWSVFARKARSDCRILWRSFSSTQHIAPLKYLNFHPANVAASLRQYPDRVAMYNSTHLATIPPTLALLPRVPYAPAASAAQDATVLFSNFLHPISGADHKSKLESFYALQASSYDSFRHRFLHGRVPMIEAMPTPKEGVWVDLGGGTGANLEHLGERLSTFAKVFILDLTPSLLAVAKERVAARGWGKLVTCVEGDATVKGVAGLPKAGTVDLVTCSYSLTMIPDWKAAIENAHHMLKPGGYIAVSDFTVRPEHSLFTRLFWPFILGQDGVRPSTAHIDYLDSRFTQVHCTVDVGGFPYVAAGASVLGGAWFAGLVAAAPFLLPSLPPAVAALLTLPATTLFPYASLATLGLGLAVVVAGALALLAAIRLLFSDARPVSSSLLATALAVGGVAYAYTQAAAHPAVVGVLATPGSLAVPTLAVAGAVGGAIGYFIGDSLKAPFYYYVAQKKL